MQAIPSVWVHREPLGHKALDCRNKIRPRNLLFPRNRSFLRTWQSLGRSKNSSHFTEPIMNTPLVTTSHGQPILTHWSDPNCHVLKFILSLSSHLCVGLYPSGIPTNILYAFLNSAMHFTWSVHPIILDLFVVTAFGEQHRLWSFFLCSCFQPPVPSVQDPNILLCTLLSDNIELCSSFN